MARWLKRPEGSNWGEFGVDDQIGRMNLVTPEIRRSALAEAREGLAFLLGLPLAFEPIERGIMHRQPRRFDMPVLDGALIRRIALVSLLLLGGVFGFFLRTLEQGHTLAEARTVAVNVFVMVEIFYLFNCRSLTSGFWKLGLFSNLWVWGGIAAMLVLQLLLTYWPPLSSLFQTAPIGWREWAEIVVFAGLCSLLIGLEKHWTTRRRST